jgi:putative intracellular protease/amidase
MRSSIFISVLFTLGAVTVTPAVAAPAAPGRVLIVVSGNGADAGKTRPGFEMDELTQAYAVFAENGLSIDIASPAGGKVEADKFDPTKLYNKRFLDDAAAVAKLTATRPMADVTREKFDGVFIIGGKGAMFDLPVNADLKSLLASTYASEGVIGAVCHGPAVLINVPLADGRKIAKGRRMTGFSNAEETLFGKRWAAQFPVLLEDGLRGAGATFSAAPMMLSHVVTDGRLVTGQNPYSTPQAAEAMIRAMGRTPKARTAWADERSIALIQSVIEERGAEARTKLAADPARYDVPLIAMWGFYRAKSAGDDRIGLTRAIEVMEIAAPHYPEPQLKAAITESKARLAALR